MNRRGFISLLAGAAGAPLVPWRGLVERVIVLAPAWSMVPISGLEMRELGVPSDWIEGPISINTDHAMIRSDRLEILKRMYAERLARVEELRQRERGPMQIWDKRSWSYRSELEPDLTHEKASRMVDALKSGTYQRYNGFTGYEETRRQLEARRPPPLPRGFAHHVEVERQLREGWLHSPDIVALVERRIREATETWRAIGDNPAAALDLILRA